MLIWTVFTELEEEANTPLAKTLQLSEPEVRYCVHMIEKYGEDYKVKTRPFMGPNPAEKDKTK